MKRERLLVRANKVANVNIDVLKDITIERVWILFGIPIFIEEIWPSRSIFVDIVP
jgi:hypothetical protein